ncbi:MULTISPECIES: hypothetical protein [unclassified Streptomyces]|uniref:hypothetical protein n=1 Tax=unclassified Streptomyces TaxID=2593676 RepID=UPI002966AAC3|nr:hypothetical protein [Streptomyces sp. SJL17-1]
MTDRRSEQMKLQMELYRLPWVEANEDLCRDGAKNLRTFQGNLPDDRADATKAVQRLVSHGQGEATKALGEHWDEFVRKFDRVAAAAGAIAEGLSGSADIIGDTKDTVIDIVEDFQRRLSLLSEGEMPGQVDHSAEEESEAAITRAQLEPEIATTRTRSNSRLTLVRNDSDVRSLKQIAGLPEGTGNGDQGAIGGVAPGITGQGDGSTAPGAESGTGGGEGGRAISGDTMRLASAGGHSSHNFWIEHDEHKRAVESLDKVATHLRDKTSAELGRAVLDVTEFGASGTLGSSIAAGYSPLVDDLVLATRALGNHLTGPLSDAIRAASKDAKDTDDETRGRFWWMR